MTRLENRGKLLEDLTLQGQRWGQPGWGTVTKKGTWTGMELCVSHAQGIPALSSNKPGCLCFCRAGGRQQTCPRAGHYPPCRGTGTGQGAVPPWAMCPRGTALGVSRLFSLPPPTPLRCSPWLQGAGGSRKGLPWHRCCGRLWAPGGTAGPSSSSLVGRGSHPRSRSRPPPHQRAAASFWLSSCCR